jgi:hypothetical protein
MMKKITLLYCFLFSGWFISASSQSVPHLEKTDNVTRLIVKDVSFLILGGELHNLSTSGAGIMRPVWNQMAQQNLKCQPG